MAEKTKLHPRNLHRSAYDFEALCSTNPLLAPFVHINKYQTQTIDFFDPEAVKMLNQTLLQQHYSIHFWKTPPDFLCPPVPGRADYLHYIADLLSEANEGKIPKSENINCLDIGVGASCIFPIIGRASYNWSFVGTEINPVAVEAAREIIKRNANLKGKVKIRQQRHATNIFKGVVKTGEQFDVSICNPPFHASKAEAAKGTARKLKNLQKGKRQKIKIANFGGQKSELYYRGGERKFVELMIQESQEFATSCFWFTTLLSKEANVKPVLKMLEKAEVKTTKVIPMAHGNKKSRIIAWTFLNEKQRKAWAKLRY